MTVETSVLMARLALSSGSRNIVSRIKGDAALASTRTKRPTPKPAASGSSMLSDPKFPRPMVIASPEAMKERRPRSFIASGRAAPQPPGRGDRYTQHRRAALDLLSVDTVQAAQDITASAGVNGGGADAPLPDVRRATKPLQVRPDTHRATTSPQVISGTPAHRARKSGTSPA
jgi:hypothetical protein